MAKRVTIIDIAHHAGVSKSTVSLVLHGSNAIKKETADKVRASMDALGYVYNRAAASLRNTKSGLVGLVVNDLRNPYFTEFAIAAQTALAAKGYVTVIANTDENADNQNDVVRSMLEHDVSAFIICPVHESDPRIFKLLGDKKVPVVQVFRHGVQGQDGVPFVGFDYAQGGRIACDHLVRQGARNIAFVGGFEAAAVTTQRRAGFVDVCKAEGMDGVTFYGRPTRAFGQEIAATLRQKHPEIDGVYCFNDLVALGCAEELQRQGVTVGQEVKVVGFDDIDATAHAYPPLTTVHCDVTAAATQAAQVIETWQKEAQVPQQDITLPVTLTVRSST